MMEESEDLLSVEEYNYTINGNGEGGEHLGTFSLFLGKKAKYLVIENPIINVFSLQVDTSVPFSQCLEPLLILARF